MVSAPEMESVPYHSNADDPVLSRMRIDTELDQVSDSSDDNDEDEDEDEDDDDVDLDSTDEFYVESDDEDPDTELLEDLAINYLADRKKGGRSGKVPFASATAFADALEVDPYYGLDMMDFNRPSLQKKGKGKKPPALDMMFSDSDLEAHLHEVWQTDRKKKKARKQEREELRAQGLLGRSTGEAADLKVKYSKGMNLEELITELRSFLLSSNTRCVRSSDSPQFHILHARHMLISFQPCTASDDEAPSKDDPRASECDAPQVAIPRQWSLTIPHAYQNLSHPRLYSQDYLQSG